MLGLTFSFKLDQGSCIISIAKIACKKIGALIRFMKFLSPEVALYLYKLPIFVTSGLVPLVATWNCQTTYKNRYAGILVLHLVLLLNPALLSNCSQFKSFILALLWQMLSELAQLVSLPFSQNRATCYFDRLHDFSVAILRCFKDVYINSFFPCSARLWNFLSIERFSLTYNLKGFNFRINRHLLTVSFY